MLLSKWLRSCQHHCRLLPVLRHCCTGSSQAGSNLNSQLKNTEPPTDFQPERAILLRKVTRYEYEKHLFKGQSDSEEALKIYVCLIFISHPVLCDRLLVYYDGTKGVSCNHFLMVLFSHVLVNIYKAVNSMVPVKNGACLLGLLLGLHC